MKIIKPEQVKVLKPKAEDRRPAFVQFAERLEVGYGLVIKKHEYDNKTLPSTLLNSRFNDRHFKLKQFSDFYLIERVK